MEAGPGGIHPRIKWPEGEGTTSPDPPAVLLLGSIGESSEYTRCVMEESGLSSTSLRRVGASVRSKRALRLVERMPERRCMVFRISSSGPPSVMMREPAGHVSVSLCVGTLSSSERVVPFGEGGEQRVAEGVCQVEA